MFIFETIFFVLFKLVKMARNIQIQAIKKSILQTAFALNTNQKRKSLCTLNPVHRPRFRI